ncbi:MAG: ABC transporter permease [bacterium]|jgi:ABC-2 type transport system permease protein|nr:ABC transporter permease [bacterium]
MRRVLAIAAKEFLHILRDPRSLLVAILMPLAMVWLYGTAIDMELRQLPIAVLDQDGGPAARSLVAEIGSSGFIQVVQHLEKRDQIEAGFRRGHFLAALVIAPGFGRGLGRDGQGELQLVVDGADGSTAATVAGYLEQALRLHDQRLAGATGHAVPSGLALESRTWFNPQRVSAWFIVPGLVAIVLIMICALLASISIVRERETGTLEQVLTAPVTPLQVILGKIQPYLLIGVLNTAVIFAVGRWVFQVPMAGSWLALWGYTLLYLWVALGLGLLISALARTQQVAMMLALVVTLLPTLLLSGFIFSHASMPWPLQLVGQLIPATWYLRIIRGVMLAGVNAWPLEGSILGAMGLLLGLLALRRFRTHLDE